MTRSICSGSPLRLLLLVAGLTFACGDDGKTTAASESTANATDSGTTAGTPTTGASSDTAGSGGYCVHQCMQDADCQVMGKDLDLTCQNNTCTVEGPSGCTDDEECVALYSGWTTACTSGGGECDALAQICVAASGGGLCATPPSDIITCDIINMVELEVPDIDGNPVTVCANPTAECNADAICFLPCKSDGDCSSDAYPVCDTNTGLCGCGSDDHCATLGQPNASICNAGVCGCNADQQCVDGKLGDTCTADGFCGCSGDAACAEIPNSYDGGAIVCGKL